MSRSGFSDAPAFFLSVLPTCTRGKGVPTLPADLWPWTQNDGGWGDEEAEEEVNGIGPVEGGHPLPRLCCACFMRIFTGLGHTTGTAVSAFGDYSRNLDDRARGCFREALCPTTMVLHHVDWRSQAGARSRVGAGAGSFCVRRSIVSYWYLGICLLKPYRSNLSPNAGKEP